MGAWGVGSGDTDGAHDWYPSKLNEKDDIIAPTAEELNKALKTYLKKGKISKSFEKEEFLGVVVLGLRDKVIADELHLIEAYKFANDLLIDKDYLGQWSDSNARAKALEKERKALMKLIVTNKLQNTKLTIGLIEALNKKKSIQKNKSDRPSPSMSATEFKVNTKKKGNDGKIWIVKKSKSNVKRWVKE